MTTENQKTLLQTIRGRLERMDDGCIAFISDLNGPWKIIQLDKPDSGFYKYFESSEGIDYDKFGIKE